MSDTKILLVTLIVVIVFLLFYCCNFFGAPLSSFTSDWGAFGNYVAVGVSMISIVLIYVTYREQRKANEITRVEQHIMTMTNTLNLLSEKYQGKVDNAYKDFYGHFDSFSLTEYNDKEKVKSVCMYYHSSIMSNVDCNHNLNGVFRYIHLFIDYIQDEKSLSEESKEQRIKELSCILSESMRIMLFSWLLFNNQNEKLEKYYKLGIFTVNEIELPLLEDIITYICTKKCPPERKIPKINPEDIDFEGYNSNEEFYNTYKRM